MNRVLPIIGMVSTAISFTTTALGATSQYGEMMAWGTAFLWAGVALAAGWERRS